MFIVYLRSGDFSVSVLDWNNSLFIVVLVVSLVLMLSLGYVCITMQLDQLYRRARRRHGELNRDVVHDLIVKFGNDMPDDSYVIKVIHHAKPLPAQEMIDVNAIEQDIEQDESHTIVRAMRNVSKKYQLEVDTFLECCVNGTYESFSEHSGISITVLKKICMFVKIQIRNEYKRLI